MIFKKKKPTDKKNKKGIDPMPLYRLFPSIVTVLALCAGLTSIRYALDFKWEASLILLIVAAFLDGMDGRIARYLKVTSEFGAQLDSLADFLNFGVAPAVILYLWTLSTIALKGMGWGFVLVFVVCCAIRLARFNAMMISPQIRQQPWQEGFFVGIPAPIGGILVILPMVMSMQWPEISLWHFPRLVGCYMVLVAFAMASRIPTFSIKKLAISHDKVALLLAVIALIVAALLIEPWATISLLSIMYLFTIPFSIKTHANLTRKFRDQTSETQ